HNSRPSIPKSRFENTVCATALNWHARLDLNEDLRFWRPVFCQLNYRRVLLGLLRRCAPDRPLFQVWRDAIKGILRTQRGMGGLHIESRRISPPPRKEFSNPFLLIP